MRRNKALKAAARKRLKVIYVVMRDAAPCAAWYSARTTRQTRDVYKRQAM